jgi:RNA ligase
VLEKLEKYQKEGWLIKQKHPRLPLEIYNYSQKTQYESYWDEVTLSCRGLIVDTVANKIIVKPLSKFFNYEEVHPEIPWKSSEYVYVQEKMDGSLGILFHYEGEWILSTRGSFTSDQAVRGLEILRKTYQLESFEKSVAYICEIIYPENRIVVNYGDERVIFLSAVLNRHYLWEEGNDELHWTTALSFFKCSGIHKKDIVSTEQIFGGLNHELYKNLKSLNTKNREGYVLRFFPSNMRVKIKFDDYVKLHRILTGVSSYDIWENLRTFGTLPEQMLKDVPDEFYSWVREREKELNEKYAIVEFQHKQAFQKFEKIENQREYALKVIEHCKEFDLKSSILFSLRTGKEYSDEIWKMIKPEYSKPFSEEN